MSPEVRQRYLLLGPDAAPNWLEQALNDQQRIAPIYEFEEAIGQPMNYYWNGTVLFEDGAPVPEGTSIRVEYVYSYGIHRSFLCGYKTDENGVRWGVRHARTDHAGGFRIDGLPNVRMRLIVELQKQNENVRHVHEGWPGSGQMIYIKRP